MIVIGSKPLFGAPWFFHLKYKIIYIVFFISDMLQIAAITNSIVLVLLISNHCNRVFYHIIVNVKLID